MHSGAIPWQCVTPLRTPMENEHICRLLLDFAADWEFWLDPEGVCRYVSPACSGSPGTAPMSS